MGSEMTSLPLSPLILRVSDAVDLADDGEGVAAQGVLELLLVAGLHLGQKAAVGLGEEQDVVALDLLACRDLGSDSTSAPSPPAKAISARATPSPPSDRSWQARTRPVRGGRAQAVHQLARGLRV